MDAGLGEASVANVAFRRQLVFTSIPARPEKMDAGLGEASVAN